MQVVMKKESNICRNQMGEAWCGDEYGQVEELELNSDRGPQIIGQEYIYDRLELVG